MDKAELRLDEACAIISRILSFDDGSAGVDHDFMLTGDPFIFRIPILDLSTGLSNPSSIGIDLDSMFSHEARWLGDFLVIFEVDIVKGFANAGLLTSEASSSSISNIKSMVESWGFILGLKGAFRIDCCFRRDFS